SLPTVPPRGVVAEAEVDPSAVTVLARHADGDLPAPLRGWTGPDMLPIVHGPVAVDDAGRRVVDLGERGRWRGGGRIAGPAKHVSVQPVTGRRDAAAPQPPRLRLCADV